MGFALNCIFSMLLGSYLINYMFKMFLTIAFRVVSNSLYCSEVLDCYQIQSQFKSGYFHVTLIENSFTFLYKIVAGLMLGI